LLQQQTETALEENKKKPSDVGGILSGCILSSRGILSGHPSVHTSNTLQLNVLFLMAHLSATKIGPINRR